MGKIIKLLYTQEGRILFQTTSSQAEAGAEAVMEQERELGQCEPGPARQTQPDLGGVFDPKCEKEEVPEPEEEERQQAGQESPPLGPGTVLCKA